MQCNERPLILTRRSLLLLAGAGLAWPGSSEFWDKKDPADWTPEEVDRLVHKSPWAKHVIGDGRTRPIGL